ncbi:MAG TPA: aminotransferase class I/II-fold pyridoxal phosphate-dependent enzyme [Polyangiaceae bacterium]|nr:aminotransferase class I/II-fold pyridoxal phosphate-dependent enzyme [Polyangiaceae bacterium]
MPIPEALAAAYDPEQFRRDGHALIDVLADYLGRASRGQLPVLERADPAALTREYATDFASPQPAALAALAARALERVNHLHHPRYVGHQVTAPLPEAALLELVSALSNNGAAVFEMGTLEVAMERALVRFMSDAVGFGESADGVFTSGGSAGNLTALLALRQSRAGSDVWRNGLGGELPCVLVSEQAHYSVKRALQIIGFGEGGVELVPADERFKLRPELLPEAERRARARGRKVIGVAASSGSTATGAYDPLEPIAAFCEERGLWLHVDGAHGAAAALSPRLRPLLAGAERADSLVWDAHKMLLMPALVTAVLFRDGKRSYEPFAQSASYLFGDVHPEEEWYNFASRTLECTKRWMALPLYTALSRRGAGFFATYVEHMAELGATFAALLREAPDFELAVPPELNIVCFRYVPREHSPAELDRLQERVRRAVVDSGQFYLVQTRLPSGIHLRTTLINPLTSEGDLVDLLAAIRAA